ncbi:MAG TPA: acetylglutamate kinase [Methanocorpusculum sp.]|nr:acetylglutamate kinase [Methanocorpusculum sp.]
MNRQSVLMEALPYIRKFHGKTIVIKLGGHAMVDPKIMNTVIEDAVLLHYVGMRVVLVHGGGPEITEKMPLKKVMVGVHEEEVDLGFVGEIREINSKLLETLLDAGYIPVVSPLAIDRKGNDLNINADTMAGEIAVALKAFKLISLTDVDGVMDKERTQVFHRLTLKNVDALMADGTISGGMIPKLEASVNAVRHGVEGAHVVNGNAEHNLLLELFTDDGVGTMITASMISL